MTLNSNIINITPKTLNVIQINENSIIKLSRRYDLVKFLSLHNPDFVMLNETKLNPKHNINFDNYNFVRKDRLGAARGGGTAILIKKGIKFKMMRNSAIDTFKYLETCIVKIPMSSNRTLYIISAYYPAGNINDFLKRELQLLFEILQLDNLNNFYILAGDLNSKHQEWGNPVNNPKGIILKNWLSDNGIKFRCNLYASVSPSFPRSGSYLDVCIADSRIHVLKEVNSINCLKILDYDSDHNAIQIMASSPINGGPFCFLKEEQLPQLNYKGTNWNKFTQTLQKSISDNTLIPNNRNLTNEEIDFHLKKLNATIIDSINKHVPKFPNKDNVRKFVNLTIKTLNKEKSKVLTKIKKHNRLERLVSTTELQLLKNNLKLLKKLLDDNFVISVTTFFRKKLNNISSKDPSQMFSNAKKLFKKYNDTNIKTLKIQQTETHLLNRADIIPQSLAIEPASSKYIIEDEAEILNVMGSYLEHIHSSKTTDINNTTHQDVTASYTQFLETKARYESEQISLSIFDENRKANKIDISDEFFITRDEIIYIFSKLRGKLSSGLDNIPNIVLKNIPLPLMSEYCTLFNNMINNLYFPKAWKLAKVIVIPKKDKDLSNPKNLRPISLLPNISKVFEICINSKIDKLCVKNKLICERQFGFKHKHSTIHAINFLTSNINWYMNKNCATGACLIDFEKAFDTIWIPGLIFKLMRYNFPMPFVILLHNMISEKRFVVCNRGQTSSKEFTIINGLQQGTVNAPILFNLFIHDLLINIENSIGFADDIVIFHADDKIEKINCKLQEKFNTAEKYSTDWNMKINAEKCETILFRPSYDKCNYNIKKKWKDFGIVSLLQNKNVANSEVVKYLGINLDKFLYFNFHVNKQIEKARKAFFNYKSLFYSKYIDKRVKIIMYQSLVRPIISYGCPIWFNISPSYMEKIRKFERKCLRSCTQLYRSPSSNFTNYFSNKLLYNASQITRIDNFIIKTIRSHIKRCTECTTNNLIMAPYYTSDEYICNALLNGFVPPEAFLYLDKKGFIQNNQGIPIFYHLFRRATTKAVNSNLINNNEIRFDTSISNQDKHDIRAINLQKYWWISL